MRRHRPMKVVVTGASGNIGTALLRVAGAEPWELELSPWLPAGLLGRQWLMIPLWTDL
jgi:nucleoside-diphosphate-sugar epimerase